jgi:hypothetical protein
MEDNPYWVAEDEFNPQAVEVLDYPDWANAETGDGGGMGSGYTAGYIRLKKGHDMDELWRWLQKRQVELQTTKSRPKKSRRKAQ